MHICTFIYFSIKPLVGKIYYVKIIKIPINKLDTSTA